MGKPSKLNSLLASVGASITLLSLFSLLALNRPADQVAEHSYLSFLTGNHTNNFQATKSLDAVTTSVRDLRESKEFCYASFFGPALDPSQQHNFGFFNFHGDQKDFSDAFLEIRAPGLTAKQCDKTQGKPYLNAEQLLRLMQAGPVLAKINLLSKDRQAAASLGFEFANGTSAVFVDGKLVRYNVDRAASMTPVVFNISLQTKLEVWLNGQGLENPGFVENQKVQLSSTTYLVSKSLDQSKSPPSGPIYAVALLGLLLLGFAFFVHRTRTEVLAIAVFGAAFSFKSIFGLSSILSVLDLRWFQWAERISLVAETLAIATLTLSVVQLTRRSFELWKNAYEDKSSESAQWEWATFLVLMSVYVGILYFSGTKKEAFLSAVGSLGVFVGLVLVYVKSRFREDSATTNAMKARSRIVLAGFGLSVFSVSSHLGLWGISVFESIVFLWLVHRELKELAVLRQITTAAHLETLPENKVQDLLAKQSATERDWVVLNELTGSGGIRFSHLAISTQVFQSALLKIHKDYFSGIAHYFGNIGDGLLMNLKSPDSPTRGDPIIEKLVRCYACHRDGVSYLKDAFKTIQSIVCFESKELAFEHAKKYLESGNKDSKVEDLKLRTVISTNLFFFGVNQENTNLESHEMRLDNMDEGGFVLFPPLMELLKISFPDLEKFFDVKPVKHSAMDHVYVLRANMDREFEIFLENLYGGPLFLRISMDRTKSFHKMSEHVAIAAAQMAGTKDLNDFLKLADHLPKTENFLEKNLLIRTIAEKAMKFNIWESVPEYEFLKKVIRDLGIPADALIQNIARRDQALEPEQVIEDMASASAYVRNSAMRFLPLARTRKDSRPYAMSEDVFLKQAVQVYFDHVEQFGVESHVYFLDFILSKHMRVEICREVLSKLENKDKIDRFFQVFEKAKAPSLHQLAGHYRAILGQVQKDSKKGVA